MGVCNCSMLCCTLLYVHYSIAIILMGKRELFALLNLSSWRLVMVERFFLAVPRGCLRFVFVIVVFHDHTHLLFFMLCYVMLKRHDEYETSRGCKCFMIKLHLPHSRTFQNAKYYIKIFYQHVLKLVRKS